VKKEANPDTTRQRSKCTGWEADPFAAFREAAGLETEAIETNATTTGSLFDQCRARHDGLQAWEASLVAINDEMAQWDSGINEGDEVLFFPPVAGG
jgi:molybdopterin converting factor small subunit